MSDSEDNFSDGGSETSSIVESPRGGAGITKLLSLADDTDLMDEFDSLISVKDCEARINKLKSLIFAFQSNYTDFSSKYYEEMVDSTMKILKKIQPDFSYSCKLLSLLSYTNSEEWPTMVNNVYPILMEIASRNNNEDYQAVALRSATFIVIFNTDDLDFIQSHFEKLQSMLKLKISNGLINEIMKSLLYTTCFYNVIISYEQLLTSLINYLQNSSIEIKSTCLESLVHFFSLYFESNNIKPSERHNKIDNHFHILYEYINKMDCQTSNKRNQSLKNNLKNLKQLLNGNEKFEKDLSRLSYVLKLSNYTDIMKYNMFKDLLGTDTILHIQNNPMLSSIFICEIEETNTRSHSAEIYHKIENKKKDRARYTVRNKARDRKYNA